MPTATDYAGGPAAGIDWISYFQPRGENDALAETLGSALVRSEARSGGMAQEARRQGFAGLAAGSTFFGERHDGYLYSVSGAAAQAAAERLRRLSGRPSRLDLAVTVPLQQRAPQYVQKAYEDWCRLPVEFGRARTARLMQENTGGSTVYIGSTQSDTMVRLYDWGHRHGEAPPGEIMRWEVQLRREAARAAWSELLPVDLATVAQAGMVYATFTDRRMQPPWEASTIRINPKRRGASDIEAKLEWLRKCVAPTVARLMQHGLQDEIVCALGLGDVL